MTPERPTCPRCDSSNTKFCYYNNYNLSQPRYFCKACRRYWTLGGSLRNIPAGGASRKNNAAAATSSTSSSSSSTHPSKRRRARLSLPSAASPFSPLSPASPAPDVPNADDGADGRAIPDASMTDMSGTFAAVLAEPLPSGFLALGDPFLHGRTGTEFDLGVGLGLGGMQEIGFELEKSESASASASVSALASAWPFSSDDGGEVVSDIGDTWKATGENPSRVGGDGDCIGWTDLAISAPGKSVR